MVKKVWAIGLKICQEERHELEQLRRKQNDYRSMRALMVLLNADGDTVPAIVRKLRVHHHTVRGILKSYQKGGIKGLDRNYSPGRPREIRDLIIKKLEIWLQKTPQTYNYPQQYWTTQLLIDMFCKETGRKVGESTMTRALKDAGYSWKRPKKTIPKDAPTKEEKKNKLKEIFKEVQGFADKEDTEILMVDETHFSTEPYNIKGWFPRGKHFPPKNSNQKRRLYRFWCLESEERTILLEEYKKR